MRNRERCPRNYNPADHPHDIWQNVVKVLPKEKKDFKEHLSQILDSLNKMVDGKKELIILDVGGGEGKFTSSLFECIYNKHQHVKLKVYLLEPVAEYREAYKDIISRIPNVACIEDIFPKISVQEFPKLQNRTLEFFDEIKNERRYDLVLASHVTYYYPDGGIALAHAIVSRALKLAGVAWFVVRDRKSPFYKCRSNILNKYRIPDVNFHQFSEPFIRSIRCLFNHFDVFNIKYDLEFGESVDISVDIKDVIQYLSWLQDLDKNDIDELLKNRYNFGETHIIVSRKELIQEYDNLCNNPSEDALLLATYTNSRCMNYITEQLVGLEESFDFYSVSLAEIKPTLSESVKLIPAYFPEDTINPVGHYTGYKIKRFGYSFLTEDSRKELEDYFNEYPSFLYFPRFYIDHSKQGGNDNIYYFATSKSEVGSDKNINHVWDISLGGEDIECEIKDEMLEKTFNNSLNRWNELICSYHLSKKTEKNINLWTLSVGTHLLPTGNYEWDDDPSLNSRCGIFFVIKTEKLNDIEKYIYPIIGHIKNTLTQYLASGVLDLVKKRNEEMKRHSEVLHLLMRPLKNMSNAITSMQRDTQELKYLLYEPSEALFESHQLIADIFEEGKIIILSDYLQPLNIEHNPHKYKNRANVVLAYILCKLFGNTNIFEGAKSDYVLLLRAANNLDELQDNHSYEGVFKQIKMLLGVHENIAFRFREYFLSEKFVDYTIPISNIKSALFTPFKYSSKKWPIIAIKILFPDVHVISNDDTLIFDYSDTPFNYKAILTFLKELKHYVNISNNEICNISINQLEVGTKEKQICEILIEFIGNYWENETNDSISINEFSKYLFHYLEERKKYSLVSMGSFGNFSSPYFNILSNILGSSWLMEIIQDGVNILKLKSENRVFSISYYDNVFNDKLKRTTSQLKLIWSKE